MYDIITIGDTMQDVFLEMTKDNAEVYCEHKPDECHLCFNYKEKIPVKSKHESVGGNAANTAVAFARLGLKVGIYTHIGTDDLADNILKQFKRNRVDATYVVADAHKETNYNTIINMLGERTILTYHVPRDYRLPKLGSSKWVYFTSMAAGFEVIIPSVLAYIREYKVKIVFQPGTFQIKSGPGMLKTILAHTGVIFMNKEEAQRYLESDSDDYFELLGGLRELGPEIAVLTDGKKGSFVSYAKKIVHLLPPPAQEIVDTTGAGDSFAAGFTAALIENKTIEEAMVWGQLEANSVIASIGAQTGLLFKKQLEQADISSLVPQLINN